jgi:hypothetical protein
MNDLTQPEKTVSQTFENLTFTDSMDLDTLRDLIANNVLPEDCDPAYMTPEDWNNYHADMAAMPLDLPTQAEIEEMPRSMGVPLPF